ncbi:putative entry exclusion protein TrbK-alt [Xanthobacter autotrophicus]|uniref:putative entry exclusion protein TrbK-alt n=1 Tax=Xanthobacter autotrophicus TaxID=280 RepID=UPI00372C02B4
MDQGTALRTLMVAAVVGAVLAALATAAGRRAEPNVVVSEKVAPVSSADLKGCAQIEIADPIDARCAAIWEESRRRFFGKPAEGGTP